MRLIADGGTGVQTKNQNISELLPVVDEEPWNFPRSIFSRMFVTACNFSSQRPHPWMLSLLSVFSVILYFFSSLSPWFHLKSQMTLMSLGWSSSSCCVSAAKNRESLRTPTVYSHSWHVYCYFAWLEANLLKIKCWHAWEMFQNCLFFLKDSCKRLREWFYKLAVIVVNKYTL